MPSLSTLKAGFNTLCTSNEKEFQETLSKMLKSLYYLASSGKYVEKQLCEGA